MPEKEKFQIDSIVAVVGVANPTSLETEGNIEEARAVLAKSIEFELAKRISQFVIESPDKQSLRIELNSHIFKSYEELYDTLAGWISKLPDIKKIIQKALSYFKEIYPNYASPQIEEIQPRRPGDGWQITISYAESASIILAVAGNRSFKVLELDKDGNFLSAKIAK